MAKAFAKIANIPATGRDEEVDRILHIQYVLGSQCIIQELMRYMSVDELRKFNDHMNQHFDLDEIEKQMVAHYNDVPF